MNVVVSVEVPLFLCVCVCVCHPLQATDCQSDSISTGGLQRCVSYSSAQACVSAALQLK